MELLRKALAGESKGDPVKAKPVFLKGVKLKFVGNLCSFDVGRRFRFRLDLLLLSLFSVWYLSAFAACS